MNTKNIKWNDEVVIRIINENNKFKKVINNELRVLKDSIIAIEHGKTDTALGMIMIATSNIEKLIK